MKGGDYQALNSDVSCHYYNLARGTRGDRTNKNKNKNKIVFV